MAFKPSFAVLFVLAASVLASKDGSQSCNASEFWYSTKNCCLPHGGPPNPPSPPPGKSCPPTAWYWHTTKSCCVPNHPPPSNPPPPQCNNGWDWNHGTQCCEPGSGTPTYTTHKPSQTPKGPGYNPPYYGHGKGAKHPGKPEHTMTESSKAKHTGAESSKTEFSGTESSKTEPSMTESPKNETPKPQAPKNPHGGNGYKKRSAAPLCPTSYEACPVSGLTGAEYECLDTTADLISCGGCASTGKGQDCTKIEGSWNVGCEVGSCAVYTCALGYKVAPDGKSCVKN